MPSEGRSLGELLAELTVATRPGRAADSVITGITTCSDDVRPGMLFVALPGNAADGHTFIADAARRGAAAIMVERDVGGALDAPLVRVADAPGALAELAAAWHGRPADRMTMVGITGTAGKTSTLALLEAALVGGGRRVGTVGSLGLAIQGETQERTVYTTPDALLLHEELARIADAGSEIAAMEVTSHALVQERVHGIRYDLGLFTNLLPLEHADYHADFQDYVQAKARFFDHIATRAPVVFNADDPVTRALVAERCAHGVGVGHHGGEDAVGVSVSDVSHTGTTLVLSVRRPIPRVGGGTIEPCQVETRLRLLGAPNVANAALAATGALCLGVEPAAIAVALAGIAPPRRRMEILHQADITVLDDTVGHPESLSAVFRVIGDLGPERVHLVFAVRGQRGERINRENATTLAIWSRRVPLESLVVTRSDEVADELNRVDDAEHEAFLAPLLAHGLDPILEPRLVDAIAAALGRARPGDLVALLGAQGMDAGAELLAREARKVAPTGPG